MISLLKVLLSTGRYGITRMRATIHSLAARQVLLGKARTLNDDFITVNERPFV